MGRNYISGELRSEMGPPDPTAKGSRLVAFDLGEFKLTQDGSGGVGYLKFTPNFRGRILGLMGISKEICADTDADGTMKPRINGTVVTQTTALTVADLNDGTNPNDTLEKTFIGTRITAADKFDADDDIDIIWTTTNAFSDGILRLMLFCEAYEA